MQRGRWVLLVATVVATTLAKDASSTTLPPPRRAFTVEDNRALIAMSPQVVVVRIASLDTIVSTPGTLSSIELRYHFETLEVLSGEAMPVAFVGQYAWGAPLRPPPIGSARAMVGRRGVVGLERVGRNWVIAQKGFPYCGFPLGIDVVRDTSDEEVAAIRHAIDCTRLEGLSVFAEVICVARLLPPVRDTIAHVRRDSVEVLDWVAGPGEAPKIEISSPIGSGERGNEALLFLARGPTGKLEPMGMGAGRFGIESGVVARLHQPLDAVLRLVRIYRFLHDARSSPAPVRARADARSHRPH